MLKVRASSAGRIMQCGPSAIPPKVPIDSTGPGAELGSLVHEMAAKIIVSHNNPVEPAQIARYTEGRDVNRADIELLLGNAYEAWKELRAGLPHPVVEQATECELAPGVMLTGHADVIDIEPPVVHIIDWKSGHKAELIDYSHQMKAYAWLALQRYAVGKEARTVLVWLRDRSYTEHRFRLEQLTDWAHDLAARIAEPDSFPYSPGEACQYCPRQHECPARLTYARTALELVANTKPETPLAPVDVIRLYRGLQYYDKLSADCRKMLRQQIANTGPVQADGCTLTLSVAKKQVIDPRAAWEVMARHLTMDEIAKVVKITKGELIKQVRAKAARGTKDAIEMMFVDELWSAGAVTIREDRSLSLIKTEEYVNADTQE